MKPELSVVIPCLNEEKNIASCLDSLIESDFPFHSMEILVVDGFSTDNTRKIIEEYSKIHPNIRLIDNRDKITPAALNKGISNASADKIMISGAHAKFSKDYIPVLMRKMIELNADVVGGIMQTLPGDESVKANSIALALSSGIGVGNSMFRIGVEKDTKVDTVPFGIYKKEVFDKVGLYNPKLIRNQDIELSGRIVSAGYSIWLCPNAVCYYLARTNFRDVAKNNFGNGIWNIYLLQETRNFKILKLRHLAPLFAIVLGLVLFVTGVVYFPAGFFPLIGVATLYIFVILYFSVKVARVKAKACFLFYSYMLIHFSYGFGMLFGLIRFGRK